MRLTSGGAKIQVLIYVIEQDIKSESYPHPISISTPSEHLISRRKY